MAIASFLIEIFAATMLLLFAVRLVRTGIERRFGALFQSLLTRHTNTFVAGGAGMVLATILQSSAAVAVLLTGFAAAGMVSFGIALAGVLGADLGSALVIQVLSYDLGWLQPALLALGGWLYLKSERANVRLMGRIILGIAFILVSLQFLREAVDPIRESAFLPAIAGYLENDYFTAFIVGAVLAFVMHSSVATILMCVTLVQIGAIPFGAGLSLVLGANLGSAFIPIWLTRDMAITARRVPVANLLLRGSAALMALIVLNLSGMDQALMVASAGQSLILAHIGFNMAVFLLATGFVTRLEMPMAVMLPESKAEKSPMDQFSVALSPLGDPSASGASVAMSSVRHELLQMVTQVERMFRPVLDIYEQDDSDAISALWQQDEKVNDQLTQIRRFVARMPRQNMSKAQVKAARGLVEYAIRLEAAGDVVSNRMTRTAQIKHTERTEFSTQGWKELSDLHAAILESFSLARHVLLVDDMDCARRLVLEKAEIKRMSRSSRKAHLKRLERGQTESFQSSDLHLETLRSMRDLHGHVAAIAYPILYRSGQVLETRLVMEMEKDATED
ncbi:Na/Pi cotransporter family protein [Ruegeria halocynthiae]|uniref:Na/Pi cotransporter family protein n=1 Tax=Ruegeria halocynthiae TaxID=985054 RepID=UPI00055CFA30|nr:Na/Pi cotransporter family protein [Ruegeria halocynthiae]